MEHPAQPFYDAGENLVVRGAQLPAHRTTQDRSGVQWMAAQQPPAWFLYIEAPVSKADHVLPCRLISGDYMLSQR